MTFSTTFILALAATRITPVHGTPYTLTTDLSYTNFFSSFDFFSGPDPTKGFVQYQPRESAIDSQLVGYFNDTSSVFLGVDYTTKDPSGRSSVRLESKNTWNKGLLVADIQHMPDSVCGAWPAFWLLGKDPWPVNGEIDILEGVNDETRNAVTLHTSAGCAVDNVTASTADMRAADVGYAGTLTTGNCDVEAEDQGKNAGCSIKAPERGVRSYGTGFNAGGGGVYVLEWTDSAITAWFFPRNSSVYRDTFAGSHTTAINGSSTASPSATNTTIPSTTLDTSTFGIPMARFAGPGCDYGQSFKDLRVIFDTTFCGEWAGKVWDDSCAAKTGVATCEEYVRENPKAFTGAYWEINALRWYEGKAGEKVKRAPVMVKEKGREYRW